MWNKSVEEAICTKNTKFFDDEFQKSPNFKSLQDEEGFTLLHFAIKHFVDEMVKYFLDQGLGELIRRWKYGNTSILHTAINNYKYSIVELLLNDGFDINSVDEQNGYTLLYIAAVQFSRHYRFTLPEPDIIFHLINRGADVNAATHSRDTPLFKAIDHDSELLLTLYLERGADMNYCDEEGQNALHRAAWRCNWNLVEILLDRGADVNSVTNNGKTALHLAASNFSDERTVDILIRRGAMINAKDNTGKTPIFMAIGDNYADDEEDEEEEDDEDDEEELDPESKQRICSITRRLLDAGAEVNQVNDAGEPAFHVALINDLDPVIELLLERGADIHAQNANGDHAIHVAVECVSERIVKTLLDKGIPIDARNSAGATPLHIAVHFGREMHIKLLLARGADINATDFDGYTPLHYAARFFSEDEDEYEDEVENIVHDVLLANGADPLTGSKDGSSPLDYAVEKSNAAMIKVLLHHLAYLEASGDSRASEVAMRGIGNDEKRLKIYQEGQMKITRMKEEKIYEKISYFDLITRNLDTLVRNEKFVSAFDSNPTIRGFDFYEKVSDRFNDALRKKNLTQLAVECLSDILCHENLPILVIERIVENIELEDLEKFEGYSKLQAELESEYDPFYSSTSIMDCCIQFVLSVLLEK